MDKIREQVASAMDELFAAADTLRKGDILVIGCSTSEIVGMRVFQNRIDLLFEITSIFDLFAVLPQRLATPYLSQKESSSHKVSCFLFFIFLLLN